MKTYIKPSISIDNLYTEKAIANSYFFTEGSPRATGQDNGPEVNISGGSWWDPVFDPNEP